MINNDKTITKKEAALYSPLTLAYLGDAVFELMVREKLVLRENAPNGKLHREAKGFVSAKAQSRFIRKILDKLTTEELHIYKRGRNANGVPPKNADPAEYSSATGLEALFGYLYLAGETARMEFLFEEGINDEKQNEKPDI